MTEVGLLAGYKAKGDLLGLVLDHMPGYVPPVQAPEATEWQARTPAWAGGEEDCFQSRTRAMVKIEDGCNDFCTFCIIPFTRGMPRSTATNEVVRLVNQRLDAGYR